MAILNDSALNDNATDRYERRYAAIIFIIIVFLTLLDILVDLSQEVEIIHITIEAFIIPLAAGGLFFIWRGVSRLHSENQNLKVDLASVREDVLKWRTETSKFVQGLAQAIDVQLNCWNLSPAEKEIALLLLKGLSHKEIAQVRNTSERTARQQALAVYGKAGLAGRAELAAFFLEDLLSPLKQN